MSRITQEYEMEAGTSVMLESCEDETMLIETVKSIVDENSQEEEEEDEEDDEYFVVPEVQGEQERRTEVTDEEAMDGDSRSDGNEAAWSEMCRVCANSSDHLIPIFEGEGLEHELCTKIHKYLPVQVSEGDTLPLHLCYHCAATLLAWHELAEGCLDAEQRLLQMQNEFQQKQQFVQSADLVGSIDEENEVVAVATVSEIDGEKQMQQQAQQIEVKGEVNEESTTNDSERCLQREVEIEAPFLDTVEVTVDSSAEKYAHLSESLSNEENEQDIINIAVIYTNEEDVQEDSENSFILTIPQIKPNNDDARVYGCRTCGIDDLTFPEFSAHVSSHSSGNRESSKMYENQEALHTAIAQSTDETIDDHMCAICSGKYPSEESLFEHLEIHTKEESYTCDLCSISFGTEPSLHAHVSLLHNITCKECGLQFGTKLSLSNHQKHFHTRMKVICEICSKGFPNKSSLRHHMPSHSDEQPFVCKKCKRAFKRSSSLYMHERSVHQKIKDFSCVVCSKKFALKTQMQTHLRVHTGERPYRCTICGKAFKTTSQLQLHKDVHFDNRPFPCTYCEKRFRRRPNLILHLRTHTGEKPHICDLCGRGFVQLGDMKKHKTTHFKLKPTRTIYGYCQSTISFVNRDRSSQPSSFKNFQKAYRTLLCSYRRGVKYSTEFLPRNAKGNSVLDIDVFKSEPAHDNALKTNGVSRIDGKVLKKFGNSDREDAKSNISSVKNIKSELITCPVCTKAFVRQTLLDKHMTVAHVNSSCTQPIKEESSAEDSECPEPEFPPVLATSPYDCKLCGKKFRLQESFRTHMRIHTGEKPFTCHICGKQFGVTGSLYYHLKHVHGGVKNHSCDICGRSFAMKAAMEDHKRIHTGERPYVCASCGKTFKTKASLYIHSKTHTDEFPHKCTYCTKAFRWRQQMLGHLTIHTGVKNHTCDVCGKGFGVKNDLTRHKRIHSEEKPYVCQQCGISFGQKRYLKSHERARHK